MQLTPRWTAGEVDGYASDTITPNPFLDLVFDTEELPYEFLTMRPGVVATTGSWRQMHLASPPISNVRCRLGEPFTEGWLTVGSRGGRGLTVGRFVDAVYRECLRSGRDPFRIGVRIEGCRSWRWPSGYRD